MPPSALLWTDGGSRDAVCIMVKLPGTADTYIVSVGTTPLPPPLPQDMQSALPSHKPPPFLCVTSAADLYRTVLYLLAQMTTTPDPPALLKSLLHAPPEPKLVRQFLADLIAKRAPVWLSDRPPSLSLPFMALHAALEALVVPPVPHFALDMARASPAHLLRTLSDDFGAIVVVMPLTGAPQLLTWRDVNKSFLLIAESDGHYGGVIRIARSAASCRITPLGESGTLRRVHIDGAAVSLTEPIDLTTVPRVITFSVQTTRVRITISGIVKREPAAPVRTHTARLLYVVRTHFCV